MTVDHISGVTELAHVFQTAAATAGPRAFAITRRYGLMAQTKIRANMSGRSGVIFDPTADEGGLPGEIGPRAVTGDLRRSVTLAFGADAGAFGGQVSALVYSNEPQVLRLELGFVGEDSLGRHYDQPPYPAWRPAFDALQDDYRAEISSLAALSA